MLAVISFAACKDAGGAGIALPTADEAARFQREYERELKEGTTTALTAVAAHYVAEGKRLALGPDGRALDSDGSEIANPTMEFVQRDGRFTCTLGCGPGEVLIDAPHELRLGALTLVASPQSGPGRVLIHDPQSPLRASFEGLAWFAPDPAAIVAARVEPSPGEDSARLTTSRGLTKDLPVFGEFRFTLAGEEHRLSGYVSGTQASADGRQTVVLVPFTDATTGDTTYPIGRYLTVEVPDGAKAIALDFNRATNPLCAYSPHFNCPIPPPGNRLAVAVEAGERYAEH